jgi:hypothetical protein
MFWGTWTNWLDFFGEQTLLKIDEELSIFRLFLFGIRYYTGDETSRMSSEQWLLLSLWLCWEWIRVVQEVEDGSPEGGPLDQEEDSMWVIGFMDPLTAFSIWDTWTPFTLALFKYFFCRAREFWNQTWVTRLDNPVRDAIRSRSCPSGFESI